MISQQKKGGTNVSNLINSAILNLLYGALGLGTVFVFLGLLVVYGFIQAFVIVIFLILIALVGSIVRMILFDKYIGLLRRK